MSDRFDAELKKAMKESTAKSLEGWEFTPSMRQAVLNRIAAEKADPDPTPARRPREINLRPYLWVASAAAVFFVAFNMVNSLGGLGGAAKKESAAPQAASSVPANKPTTAQESAPAGNTGKAEARSGSGANAQADAFGPPRTTASAELPAARATVESKVSADAIMVTPPAPARIHLTVPDLPARSEKIQPMTREVTTTALMGARREPLSMVRVGAQSFVLHQSGLQALDAGGAIIWEQPLAEGVGPLVTADGHIGTSAGRELLLFDTQGKQLLSQTLPAAPEAIAFSPDGRAAAGFSSSVQVYQAGALQFQVEDVRSAQIAFGPDGSLAVAGEGYIRLFDRDGRQLWKVPGGGLGITFAASGQVVVAGGTAVNRAGQVIWQLPMRVQDLLRLGETGPVVAWENGQLTLRRPEDGAELWTAEHNAVQIMRVAASDSGDQVAILAGTDDGSVVWVLSQAGGQRYSEKLPVRASGVAVEGDTLFLLTPNGVETRVLEPR